MATRRIARGRGPSPVPIIILVVLVVGLLGSTIVLGLKVGDMQANIEDGLRSVQGTVQITEQEVQGYATQPLRNAIRVLIERARKKELEKLQEFQSIVGLNYDSLDQDRRMLADDLKKRGALPLAQGPGGFPDLRTLLFAYADRTAALERQVNELEGKLTGVKAELEQARKDAAAEVKTREEQIASLKQTIDQLRREKADLEAKLDKATKDLAAKTEALKTQKVQAEKKISALKKEIENLSDKLKQKDELIADLRFPKKVTGSLITPRETEPPDGKILSIDPDGQFAMVDLGRRDWVAVGMVFQVYDNADPEARKAKGSIQIRRVYDDISRAKVLKQDPVDPILPGMIVVNPAFKRGLKLEFFLQGPFRNSRAYIERLLSLYRCTIANRVSRTTDYVITGEGTPEEGGVKPEESEAVLLAKQLRIPTMKETDLLRYLGEAD